MNKRIWVLLGLLMLIGLYLGFDLGRFLNLETFKTYQHELVEFYQQQPWWVISVYSISYIVMAALSLPGAGVMSLAGGALFGFWSGPNRVVVSYAWRNPCVSCSTLSFWKLG